MKKKAPMKELNVSSPSPMGVINKMSRQFRTVDEDISFKNSPRYLRKDVFTSSSVSTPLSPGATPKDCYEFNVGDDECRLQLDLSPIKSEQIPGKHRQSNRSKGGQDIKLNRSKTEKALRRTSSVKRLKTAKSTSVAKKSTRASRKELPTPVNKPKTPTNVDSGVYMTPPLVCEDIKLKGVPTSTPAAATSRVRSSPNKSTRALRSSLSSIAKESETLTGPGYTYPTSPKLSPVKKIRISTSNEMGVLASNKHDSMDYHPSGKDPDSSEPHSEHNTTLDVRRTYSYSELGFFDIPLSSKKKRYKKSKRQSASHYDVIADQINQEFDDIENFQLSMD